MDYDKFKKEFKKYDNHDWTKEDKRYEPFDNWEVPTIEDGRHWLKIVEGYNKVGPVDNDGNFYHPQAQNDMVNSPSHYTRGTQEAIDIIEEAIQDAPDVKAGMLQAQTLKYLLRLWLKGNAPQDANKSRWYLERLIKHLKETE
jgi:hypothetical protein